MAVDRVVAGKDDKKALSTPGTRSLDDIVKALLSETEPGRKTLFDQINEALKTGGVGAQIPIVSRAIEGSKRATSDALRGIDARASQAGIAGTPFAESIRAGAAVEGAARTADVGPQVTLEFLARALPGLFGQTGQAVSGAQTVAQAETQMNIADQQRQAAERKAFWDNVYSASTMGAGGGARGGGGGGGGTGAGGPF